MYFLEYLQNTPPAFYSCMGVLGLIIGSFMNVVIYRLPKMLEADWQRQCRALLDLEQPEKENKNEISLVSPGSHCPGCGHKITALENIPLLSYVFLAGKCSACETAIPVRYPLIELLSGILAVFVSWHFGFGVQALFAVLLSWVLLTLSVIDIDHQLLPDDITMPFLWLGILVNIFGLFTDIYSSLFGVMGGYSVLWVVYIAFKKLTGKEGMGHGDFKLLAMLGAWTGWQMLPLIILLSSLLGAIMGIGMILVKNHDRNVPIPFGPYLALAGWIALIWGHEITTAYYQWSTAP